MTITVDALRAALADFPDPETGRGVVATGQVRDLAIASGQASFTLELTTHSAPLALETQAAAVEHVQRKLPQLAAVDVALAAHDRPPAPLGQIGLTAKSVIAVGSGKGGVGKSTIAAALAYGLSRAGCRVGLLDADVYGPSIPHLFGLNGQAELEDGKIKPFYKGELAIMSMGFLVPAGKAVVWRGPMLHGAITQMLRDTRWGPLDYLLIDMPPGTGDIALTLSQIVPLTGAVVVCTPQEVALIDAVRAIAMFNTVQIPILGVVENMSGFICPQCGVRYDIFGRGGARDKAEELGAPFLGEAPLNMALRIAGDGGQIADVFDDPLTAAPLDQIRYQLVKGLSQRAAAQPAIPSLPVL